MQTRLETIECVEVDLLDALVLGQEEHKLFLFPVLSGRHDLVGNEVEWQHDFVL